MDVGVTHICSRIPSNPIRSDTRICTAHVHTQHTHMQSTNANNMKFEPAKLSERIKIQKKILYSVYLFVLVSENVAQCALDARVFARFSGILANERWGWSCCSCCFFFLLLLLLLVVAR